MLEIIKTLYTNKHDLFWKYYIISSIQKQE